MFVELPTITCRLLYERHTGRRWGSFLAFTEPGRCWAQRGARSTVCGTTSSVRGHLLCSSAGVGWIGS